MGKSPVWAAVDLSGVSFTTGTVTEGGTLGVDYNSDYASLAMMMGLGATVEFGNWAADDAYFSGSFGLRLPSLPASNLPWLAIYDQDSQPIVEFVLTTAGVIQMWVAATMVASAAGNTDLRRACVRINTFDSRIQLLLDKAPFLDAEGLDLSAVTGVSEVIFTAPVANMALSSFVFDNEDTLTRYTVPLDFLAEDTTYNQLTGIIADLTDRDNITGYVASAVNHSTLFTHTPIPTIGGADVSCLCLTAKIGDLVGLAGFKFSLEFDSTIYNSSGTLAADGFLTFPVNPFDSADWSLNDINAAIMGFKSV